MTDRYHPPTQEVRPEDASLELATRQYYNLLRTVDQGLAPHHTITYVPLTPEQQLDRPDHFCYADKESMESIMASADIIVCVSRDDVLDPTYSDRQPTHNIALAPSSVSNVDRSVELYHIAQSVGNNDIKFVSTGRMNNSQIRMMLALPVIAESIGINAEDAYHIPEASFEKMLYGAVSPEFIKSIDAGISAGGTLTPNYKALKEFIPDVGSTGMDEDSLRYTADAIFTAYTNYPRVSISQLMIERAVEGGVPLEAIYEEDGAVDTISNFVNIAKMMDGIEELRPEGDKKQVVVIVAGSDHLPRTTWIADHVLPDDREIVSVESAPALDEEAYAVSCERERLSFGKGSKWIGDTRDITALEAIVEEGYFGVNRKTTEQIAKGVASVALGRKAKYM